MKNDMPTLIEEPTKHNHDPVASEKDVCKASIKLKDLAKNSSIPPSHIIRQAEIDCPQETRVYLPNKNNQKSKIARMRKIGMYKEPKKISDIKIPDHLRFLEGEQFLLSDKDFYGDKIILLGTPTSLKILSEAECWIMDGTFFVVPRIMRQLFTIHGKVGNQVVPLIFCLMTKKSKDCYVELFYELHRIAIDYDIHINPKKIICDFEKAIYSSAKSFFPSTEFSGCLFHFGQNIWRQVQKSRLSAKYGNDETFSIQIRMLKSLAFVPAMEIPSYFSELHNSFDQGARKIGNWFKKNYIGSDIKRPCFEPEFWSIDGSLKMNVPLSQNCVEAWHRRLKLIVAKRHCGLYKLIENLGKELIVSNNIIAKINSGQFFKKNKKWQTKYKNLKKVNKNRQNSTKLEYLKNIAINVHLITK